MADGRIAEILNRAQTSFAAHRKCIEQMKAVRSADSAGFDPILLQTLRHVLLVFRRDPCIERLIQFTVSFAGHAGPQDGPDQGLIYRLIDALCDGSGAKEKALRFRSCQLVAGLLSVMGDDAEITEEIWSKVMSQMTARLRDRVPVVRVYAVHALARFQDPSTADDLVTKEFLRIMGSDPSRDVRKAVLSTIAISQFTLDAVLQRTRDVNEDVRKHAFVVIEHKIPVRSLTIAQRTSLVRWGLRDRYEYADMYLLMAVCLPPTDGRLQKEFLGSQVLSGHDLQVVAARVRFRHSEAPEEPGCGAV